MPYRLIKELHALEAMVLDVPLRADQLLTDYRLPLPERVCEHVDRIVLESQVLLTDYNRPTARQSYVLKQHGYGLLSQEDRFKRIRYYIQTTKGLIELQN